MKTILALVTLTLATSTAAFASVPAGQAILASVNQLEADAKSFSAMIGEQDCSLKVLKNAEGIRIGMQSEADGFAWIDVKYTDAVALLQTYESDGSYIKEYSVAGQGKLTAISADDSYFHAKLESHGKTISCELDF